MKSKKDINIQRLIKNNQTLEEKEKMNSLQSGYYINVKTGEVIKEIQHLQKYTAYHILVEGSVYVMIIMDEGLLFSTISLRVFNYHINFSVCGKNFTDHNNTIAYTVKWFKNNTFKHWDKNKYGALTVFKCEKSGEINSITTPRSLVNKK